MACFHIRWSDSTFDWECHITPTAAELSAKELVRPGETFAIVKCHDGDDTLPCPSLGSKHTGLRRFGICGLSRVVENALKE
jgi:hypothetical protein